MSRCLSASEIADHLAGMPHHDEHVRNCSRCSMLARALANVDEVGQLDATLNELDLRQQYARDAVEELESSLVHHWSMRAATDLRLHRPEGVRRLLVRANEIYPMSPQHALELCRSAAMASTAGQVSATLRFEVLKDLAKFLLRVDDDLSGAEAALREAKELIEATDDPSYHAAVLDHARAYLYGDASFGRWEEALRLLDCCEPVFHRQDVKRWRAVRHLRAAVLLRASRYVEGAAVYAELLASEPDEYARALLRSDLAECHIRTGRGAEAAKLAEDALRVLAARPHTVSLAHTMFIHGEALSMLGDHDAAIAMLLAVSRVFATAGLRDAELRAELAIVRAQLAAEPLANVSARLKGAYLLACALDKEQPLRSGAVRATAWSELASAYERRTLSAEALGYVAEYMRKLGRGDETMFVPFPESSSLD